MDMRDYVMFVEETLQEEFGLSIEDVDMQHVTASYLEGETAEYCARTLAEALGYSPLAA